MTMNVIAPKTTFNELRKLPKSEAEPIVAGKNGTIPMINKITPTVKSHILLLTNFGFASKKAASIVTNPTIILTMERGIPGMKTAISGMSAITPNMIKPIALIHNHNFESKGFKL
jgi:hypothetical protein